MTALDVSNISMPIAALIASLIGASATITASLINLRIAWRKEMKARESRAPISKKTRRGPVAAVIVLVVASAVGGFALSQYFAAGSRETVKTMEAEMHARLDQLSDLAKTLERANIPRAEDQAPASTPVGRGDTVASAAVMLAPCVVRAGGADEPCSEQNAQRVVFCAGLPAGTMPTRIERYARDENDARPWDQVLVAPGQQPPAGQFVGEPKIDAESRTVCQEFMNWSSQGRVARLSVSYAPTVAQTTAPGQP